MRPRALLKSQSYSLATVNSQWCKPVINKFLVNSQKFNSATLNSQSFKTIQKQLFSCTHGWFKPLVNLVVSTYCMTFNEPQWIQHSKPAISMSSGHSWQGPWALEISQWFKLAQGTTLVLKKYDPRTLSKMGNKG
jgi:hypothetical protein